MDFQFQEVKIIYIDHSWIQRQFGLLQCSLSIFPIPPSQRVLRIIYSPLDHFHPTSADHPSLYLSTCPIRHHFWFSMSCGSQCSTIQKSSPHKCGQKSSCSAFNTVVATFPQIFLGLLPSRMFMRHVPIIGVS